jgi:hypothetical protein
MSQPNGANDEGGTVVKVKASEVGSLFDGPVQAGDTVVYNGAVHKVLNDDLMYDQMKKGGTGQGQMKKGGTGQVSHIGNRQNLDLLIPILRSMDTSGDGKLNGHELVTMIALMTTYVVSCSVNKHRVDTTYVRYESRMPAASIAGGGGVGL